jgi:hypothetical protein
VTASTLPILSEATQQLRRGHRCILAGIATHQLASFVPHGEWEAKSPPIHLCTGNFVERGPASSAT